MINIQNRLAWLLRYVIALVAAAAGITAPDGYGKAASQATGPAFYLVPGRGCCCVCHPLFVWHVCKFEPRSTTERQIL